jgi:hypothetical protein
MVEQNNSSKSFPFLFMIRNCFSRLLPNFLKQTKSTRALRTRFITTKCASSLLFRNYCSVNSLYLFNREYGQLAIQPLEWDKKLLFLNQKQIYHSSRFKTIIYAMNYEATPSRIKSKQREANKRRKAYLAEVLRIRNMQLFRSTGQH